MKTMTIRNVPADLARALEEEKRRRDTSLNQTVIGLLRQALGQPGGERSNGLATLAGAWSEADFESFERAVAPFEQVDAELWQ